MMEAARISETSVDIQLRTRQYIPEDSELHTRRREDLKSHICIALFNYSKVCTLVSMFTSHTMVTVVTKTDPAMEHTVAQVWLQLSHKDLVTMVTKHNTSQYQPEEWLWQRGHLQWHDFRTEFH
jgi:hypothetical protein